MKLKCTILACICLLSLHTLFGQGITTASLSGTVLDSKKEAVIGATIIAVYEPTGAKYGTATDASGHYQIPNVQVGGPYTITATYVGYKDQKQQNISLQLGQNLRLNFTLQEENSQLGEVTIVADQLFDANRTGASTNIDGKQLATLPTLNRSLEDFVRLTPQFSSTSGGGLSFAGQNNRFNNIMIDGAVNNDVFGLNAQGTPGGRTGSQPVSLDAVKAIQVIIAPYDVRQSGFVGGGVNAVTRSGTNTTEGSIYGFYKSVDLTGFKVEGSDVNITTFQDYQSGFRVGGAIKKNKLFYFVNAEIGRRTQPNTTNLRTFVRNDADYAKLVSELTDLKTLVQNKYNYNIGNITEDFQDVRNNNKIFLRFDYNLNDKHTITLRHNFIDAFTTDIFRNSSTLSLPSAGVKINNRTNSTVFEVQSRFNNKLSNELRIGYTNVYDYRANNERDFPSIIVPTSSIPNVYFGTGRDNALNSLQQHLIEFTNNLTWIRGDHTLVMGTRNEIYFFDNKFLQYGTGEWRFSSILKPTDPLASDFSFESGVPSAFQRGYSRTSDPRQGAKWGAVQLGLYAQDEWQVNNRLRLTLGLRADLPFMAQDVSYNPTFEQTFLLNNTEKPTPKVLWSPRIGFNWDVFNNSKTQVRGGIGIFAGRPPFVWLSNQYSNTGVDFGFVNFTQQQINNTFLPNGQPISQEQREQILSNPAFLPAGAGGTQGTSVINLTNPNLKLPQVFRLSAAIDQKLPLWGLVGTIEVLYTKTLNDLYVRNINLGQQKSILNFENRPVFGTLGNPSTPNNLDNTSFNGVYVLENNNKGYQASITTQLQKKAGDLFGGIAYTYSDARDLVSMTSSVSRSNFNNAVVGNTSPNNPQMAASDFNVRHRIVGSFGYTQKWNENGVTNFAMFYNGQSGNNYSFIVGAATGATISSDINADGITFNDLIYVPRTQSEISLTSFTRNINITNLGVTDATGKAITSYAYTVTPQEQWRVLNDFIEGEKSLKNQRGKFAERNGAVGPWNHRFDVRLTHTILAPSNKLKHQVQITWDIINIGNLLNSNWGVSRFARSNILQASSFNAQTETVNYNVNADITIESFKKDNAGNYIFDKGLPVIDKANVRYDREGTSFSLGSIWQMQFGVRYSF